MCARRQGPSDVSANISGVNQAATVAGEGAGQVVTAAQSPGQQAVSLRREIGKFFEDVRAA